jgi:hypothetical protein
MDNPNVSVIDWESLDQSVWTTAKSLLLIPPEVIEASMKIPFTKGIPISNNGSIYCGKHCDLKNVIEKDKKATEADIERHTGSANQE